MDTREFEHKLATLYRYKKLPLTEEQQAKKRYLDNMPAFLHLEGDKFTFLRTTYGTLLCIGYKRVVVDDYGAFIEFDEENAMCDFVCKEREEYRFCHEIYPNVKYYYLTINDGSNIKIYKQLKTVAYADYKPGMYYVSVHEIVPS